MSICLCINMCFSFFSVKSHFYAALQVEWLLMKLCFKLHQIMCVVSVSLQNVTSTSVHLLLLFGSCVSQFRF